MKLTRLLYWMPWGIGLLYFILSMQLPFWGDSIASVSKAAVRIYEAGLTRPWNYPDADPGHPTLFPWIIALSWSLFGKSLWVAHVLIALCGVALLKLMQNFLVLYEERLQVWGLILIAISPMFLSQAMEISLALPLTLAFFAAVKGIRNKINWLWVLSMIALSLLHLQGMMLLAALGLYDILRSWPLKRVWWKRSVYYFLPLVSFSIWCWFHKAEFGWAIFTPNYDRSTPGLGNILYNLAISAWRLLDLGYFILLIPVFYYFISSIIKRRISDVDRLFIPVFLVLCIGIPIIFAYPPNHRYMFPVYLLLVPMFLRFIQKRSQKAQLSWLICSFFILLSGNLWYYPGKCLGDQNLVFLSYLDIEQEMIAALPKETKIYSFAPLNNASKYTWLKERRALSYFDLYDKNFDQVDWIVESNLNCEFTPEMRSYLRAHFQARSFEAFGVYANVWMNKRLIETYPDFPGQAHQAGAFESFIKSTKQRLKN